MKRLAAVIAVLAATVMLTGCGAGVRFGSEEPTCTRQIATSTETSKIDPEGIACILESHEARFDMSAGPIDKAALGLSADEYAPDVSSDDGLIRLEIVGPNGTLETSTDRIRFFTTDTLPSVERVTYFLTADTQEDFFDLIRQGVILYGINSDDVEAWIDSVTSRTNVKSDFAFDPGTTLGFNVSYDLRYDETKSVQVIIVEVFPL